MFQQVNKTDKVTYTTVMIPIMKCRFIQPTSTVTSLMHICFPTPNEGYRYNLTVQLAKSYNFGFNFFAAYTYGGMLKDITNGIRNSMESNWQMNQSLTPNNQSIGNI